MDDKIIIHGAREHNLKNITLELPKRSLIVFTGISGSGKSSLAFDTLYAEGQRRYIESLSSYARQFLGQLKKPDVESIEGLSPAISIDQKSTSHNPRSTVGTVTEVYDYLRLLYAKIGVAHCPTCGRTVTSMSIDQIVDTIIERALKEKRTSVTIWAPAIDQRKGEYDELLVTLYRRGFAQAEVDGELVTLQATATPLSRYKQHTIRVLIDTVPIDDNHLSQLSEAVELAIDTTNGRLEVIYNEGSESKRKNSSEKQLFNAKRSCAFDGTSIPDYEPRSFSFNSPYGACSDCDGLGTQEIFDETLIIPDKSKTIREGGILPWTFKVSNYYGAMLLAACEHFRIPLDRPIRSLDPDDLRTLIYGPNEPTRIPIRYWSMGAAQSFTMRFIGVIPNLERRYKETESPKIREELSRYISRNPCETCHGARLKHEILLVTINDKNISDVSNLTISQAHDFFEKLPLASNDKLIAQPILKEIYNRLQFLCDVGLSYLTLSRHAATLAGGEAQRIRLASQIGSALTGILYVLDEPSIGLHPRDSARLIEILKKLRDLGNTVLVVEHDEAMMREADHLVDVGPRAGRLGGEIVAFGSMDDLAKAPNSITGQYLTGAKSIAVPKKRRSGIRKMLSIVGAKEHNLKDIRVDIPLGTFVCITGVSGSGKSTLVHDVLYQALARKLMGQMTKPGDFRELIGVEQVGKVILIDQSPIGRTPRSNPATYTNVFTPIRELFASLPEARGRGYKAGRFSFNIPGGRCEHCHGDGVLQIAMQFLPDVYVPCDVCNGARYNRETLAVHYRGYSIDQILRLSVTEALEVFEDLPKITTVLSVLEKVGLGYIELGQSATTLSGGEAQRVKLATELARSGRGHTLYVLDEPTTGLHIDDVSQLLGVLNALVDAGNTVLVIEHHLDVIKQADYIIDLGPEGGEEGGRIVAVGTPEDIAAEPKSHTGRFLKEILK